MISMISIMISYMMARCLYPPPKTRCIERCQSRALQVQVQDVQNRRWWSGALLDDARLVLGVRRRPASCVPVRCRPGASSPPPSLPSLPCRPTETAPVDALVLQRQRPLRRRHRRWIIVWLDAACRVVLPEVEQAACKNSRISWALRMD
jgi:hypothetical protein